MAESCSRHPDRASEGVCVKCGGQTCVMCRVDVDGAHYCSIICFTEAALATKRKTLREPSPAPDPLADLDLSKSPAPADSEAPVEDPSIVLSAQQAESQDDSSLLLKKDDASETSILDMGDLKPAEESSILQMKAKQDHTSILGMGAIAKKPSDLPTWMDEPPKTETPLPMVLPGTRRTTIETNCVFHQDTPAIVRCSRCGDSICTLCVTDEAQGGRCSPACRRDLAARARKRLIRGLLIGTAAAGTLFIAVRVLGSKKEEPPKFTPPITTAETDARAEAAGIARATEEARARVKAREEAAAKEAALAKAKALEEAQARALAEAAQAEALAKAKAREEAEAKAKAEAAKAEALAKKKAAEEAEARAKAEADALAKKKAAEEAEARTKAEALAKAEAAAKAEALAKKKAAEEAEARAKAEALAKAEAAEKAEALAKAKALEEADAREKAKRAAIESALTTAALRIREAAPLYEQLAGRYQRDAEDPERASQLALASQVRSKLAEAQTLYRDVKESAPSPEQIASRLKALTSLIESLDLVLQEPPAPSR